VTAADGGRLAEGTLPAADPRELADRLAIYELYARYAQAADLRDGAAYASCFTADGWTDISSFGHVDQLRARGITFVDPDGKVRGRENLAAIAAKPADAELYRHFTVNALVTSLAGDRATGQAYFLVVSPSGQIHQFGRYVDVIVRDGDGQWRFSERMDLAAFNKGTTLKG
jgi:SnoaL-like domain